MILNRRSLILAAGATALAACDTRSLDRTVGAEVNEGGFGGPTAHNLALHRGQIDYAVVMGQRFAAEVPTTVNFDFDSATLDAEAQAILTRQAQWIRQFPEVRFSVFGHTDLVGTERYNHALGLRRARAVVAFLAHQGIGRGRLEALVSRGRREPLIATQQPERQNRRAVTQVSGFVRRHPTVMSGQYAAVIHREFVESATYVRTSVYR